MSNGDKASLIFLLILVLLKNIFSFPSRVEEDHVSDQNDCISATRPQKGFTISNNFSVDIRMPGVVPAEVSCFNSLKKKRKCCCEMTLTCVFFLILLSDCSPTLTCALPFNCQPVKMHMLVSWSLSSFFWLLCSKPTRIHWLCCFLLYSGLHTSCQHENSPSHDIVRLSDSGFNQQLLVTVNLSAISLRCRFSEQQQWSASIRLSSRDCGGVQGTCKDEASIMYAWARNAPPTLLPKGWLSIYLENICSGTPCVQS